MLTTLLLAACAGHGHELDEPTPPDAGGWCSLEEEVAGQCAGEPLKPEPVFADPELPPEPPEAPLTITDPRPYVGPLAAQSPLALESRVYLDDSVGVRLGGTFIDNETAATVAGGITVAVSKAAVRRHRRQLRREARDERRRDRST
jgi:hypothetical protein